MTGFHRRALAITPLTRTLLGIVCAGAVLLPALARADEADTAYQTGLALKRAGKPDEALPYIEKALQLRHSYTSARIVVGWLYLKKQRYQEAIRNFEIAAGQARGPRARQQTYAGLGTAHARQNRWVEAEKALSEAYRIQQDDPDVNMNLGYVYRQLRQYDKAVVYAMLALAARPEDAQIMSNLGVALRYSGNFGEAEGVMRKALTLQPQNAVIHFNLGTIYRRQKKNDLAMKHFAESIKLKPTFPDPYFDAGIVYGMGGHKKEAIAYFQKYLELTGRVGADAREAEKRLKELGAVE